MLKPEDLFEGLSYEELDGFLNRPSEEAPQVVAEEPDVSQEAPSTDDKEVVDDTQSLPQPEPVPEH